MKHVVLQKPSLSEIFAAMKGVRCAGFAVLDNSESTSHPLVNLGIQAIEVSYDVRTLLTGSSGIHVQLTKNPEHKANLSSENIERAAAQCLKFLDNVRSSLEPYASVSLKESNQTTGGTVSDLITHISTLVKLEKIGHGRSSAKISLEGQVKPVFEASYLPGFHKDEKSSKSGTHQNVAPQPVI